MCRRGEVHRFGHEGSRRRALFLDVKNKRKFEYVDSRSVVDDLVSICGAHNLLDLAVCTSSVSWNEMTTDLLPSRMYELGRVHISTCEGYTNRGKPYLSVVE